MDSALTGGVFLWLQPVIAAADGSPYHTLHFASLLSHLAREAAKALHSREWLVIAVISADLLPCIRFLPCSFLLSLSRKSFLAAPCGNHHRRRRWNGYSRESALSAVVAMETTFTQVLLVCSPSWIRTACSLNWQIWKRTQTLSLPLSQTHTHTHTHTHRESKMIKSVAHLFVYTLATSSSVSCLLRHCPCHHLSIFPLCSENIIC